MSRPRVFKGAISSSDESAAISSGRSRTACGPSRCSSSAGGFGETGHALGAGQRAQERQQIFASRLTEEQAIDQALRAQADGMEQRRGDERAGDGHGMSGPLVEEVAGGGDQRQVDDEDEAG